MYTVKQLAELAGVSVRTLHYYDEIDLLRPSKVGSNSYRYYDDTAVMKLQQILFYREIGLELMQIKELLSRPDFDLVQALHSHRRVLQEKLGRLHKLIDTVDQTIAHLEGERAMSKRAMFQAFSEEKQKEYEREARLTYGPTLVNESIKRWNGYDKAEQKRILDEGGDIYHDLALALEAGTPPQSAAVLAILERWHEHLRYFYEPTLDVLRGLGDTYRTHPEFIANFQKLHPDLPEYLHAGITQYVDDLEYAEIVRMLEADEAQKGRLG